MPFRHLFRQQAEYQDFHSPYALQGNQNSPLAIVDPETVDHIGWHEMDVTTTPLQNWSSMRIDSSSQKCQSDMDWDEACGPNHRNLQPAHIHDRGMTRDTTGLSHQDGAVTAPSELPERNERDFSEDYTYSQLLNSRTEATERLCPLITGEVDNCQPSRCGPDAPCMEFTSLPPIEECTSVPCIGTTSPEEIMTNNDTMAVEMHRSAPRRARTSTNSTSQSSLRRRSSDSTVTTVDSRQNNDARTKHNSTGQRRQIRASNNAGSLSVPISTTTSSEKDDELHVLAAQQPGQKANKRTTKSSAPSKADARKRAKQAHSLIERKYRENLNARIVQLHSTLQNSHYGPRLTEGDNNSDRKSAPHSIRDNTMLSSKVRKSDVLCEAMNYVNQAEVEMRHMENEIRRLNERVRVLERLVRCEDCSFLKSVTGMHLRGV